MGGGDPRFLVWGRTTFLTGIVIYCNLITFELNLFHLAQI